MPFADAESDRARRDFPALTRTHGDRPLAFLDGPAGTQVPDSVLRAMEDYYVNRNANTHGAFPTSRETDALLESVRSAVATFLGAADWRTISFGQNMTTLAYSLARGLVRTLDRGDEVVITALDHEGNRGPWLALREHGIEIREVRLAADGQLDMEHLAELVGPRTRLVCMGYASNVTGGVNDLAPARALTREHGALLLVDAVHQAAHFPIDVTALDCDFLLCSAYKFYGPHVGLLYSRPGLLDSIPTDHLRIQEPEAPWKIETGTLNHAALAGVKAAIEYIATWGEGASLRERIVSAMNSIAAHEHGLAARYHDAVRRLPGARVLGPGFGDGPRCPTVSVHFEGRDAGDLARGLADRAVQVWHGDCGAVRPQEALGVWGKGGAVRMGVVMYNTASEVDRLLGGLTELL